MVRITLCPKPLDAGLTSQFHHRPKRLRGETLSPRILRQYVAGHGQERRPEREASPSEEKAIRVSRIDKVRSRRPKLPIPFAPCQKCVRIRDGAVRRPAHVAGDNRISGVALEDRLAVLQCWFPQHQTRCLKRPGTFHRPRSPCSKTMFDGLANLPKMSKWINHAANPPAIALVDNRP